MKDHRNYESLVQGIIPPFLVKTEKISLPKVRQSIIPILQLLLPSLQVQYATGEGIFKSDVGQWQLAKCFPAKLEIPMEEYALLLRRMEDLGIVEFRLRS